MMIVNKKGFNIGFDPAEAEDVGVNIVYQFEETKAINLLRAMSDKSVSELRRKIKEGGIYFGEEKLVDPDERIEVTKASVAMSVYLGKELLGVVVPKP